MKKIIACLAIAVSLSGCSAMDAVTSAGQFVTASVVNPVGTTQLAQIESAYGIALSGAVGYRNACDQKTIPRSCRDVVLKLQEADRKAQIAIDTANSFVRNNPTLDASRVISEVSKATAAWKAIAKKNGVV